MLLSSITLKNLLSFKSATLELRPLNVLIGPNGSGKSNFIEAIGLLQAAPVDLNRAIMQGGAYHKGAHAMRLLELLNPQAARDASRNCDRLFQILIAQCTG